MKEKEVRENLMALLEKKKKDYAKLNIADAAKILGGDSVVNPGGETSNELPENKFRHDMLRW